jgi:hypothetical protein
MKEKLHALYEFLLANGVYNKEFQEKEYKKILYQHEGTEDKVIALLYNIVNTQSQPKIDLIAEFFRSDVWGNYGRLNSFNSFVGVLGGSGDVCYEDLFENLKNKNGWGDKTAALFTKVIYNVHCGRYIKDLEIWDDAPTTLENDRIYLPVDAVIIDIFRRLGLSSPSFKSINKELQRHFAASEMAIWDDLWFWGFINQKGSGEKRTNEWNQNKYWALENSNKKHSIIYEIEAKSERFRQLVS